MPIAFAMFCPHSFEWHKNQKIFRRFVSERSVHEGKQLLYRYTIWAFRDEPIRIYVYSDTDKAVLTNTFPAWIDCTLTKEGYELFSNPERLIDRLNRVAIELMDIR